MVSRTFALLALFVCCSISYAEEAVEIPMSEIWALNMPGTKDISTIEDKRGAGYTGPPTRRIFERARLSLMKKPPEKQAHPGFAVTGTGRRALAWVSSELYKDGSMWSDSPLDSEEEISLTFFSYSSAYYVHIEKVERRGNRFCIEYRFVPHFTVESTVHMALIPVGRLPAGQYPVEIIQLPLEKKYIDKGFQPPSEEEAKRIVCQPYTFQVYERPAPDPGPAKDATVIPLDQIWALDMPGTKDVRELTPEPYANLSIGPLGTIDQLMGKKEAGAGYAVPGTGREALIAARKKMAPGEVPPNELPVGTDVSIVYYSHAYAPFIVLHRVERQGNTINIRYRFDGSGNTNYSAHFALIPLGKLPVGDYEVNMIPVWDNVVKESPSYYLGIADDLPRVVCQSFKFSIKPVDNE